MRSLSARGLEHMSMAVCALLAACTPTGGAISVGAAVGRVVCGRARAPLPLRRLGLRGGAEHGPEVAKSSMAGSGRVADLWDVHKFSTRDRGMVAIFRHARLGTALELSETNDGLVAFVEHDGRNATFAMAHGRMRHGDERRARSYTPLVRNGRTWWDAQEGFQAPDTLEALREEGGQRPMVAEWFDVGEGSGWEAYDDGTQPFVRITNSDVGGEVFLTADGFILLGAPAGPEQPHKPQGILVQDAAPAIQLSLAEATQRIASLPPWTREPGYGGQHGGQGETASLGARRETVRLMMLCGEATPGDEGGDGKRGAANESLGSCA